MPQYKGTVKEVGGVEIGSTGKEKPRKIVISDSPTYAGKTFRIWGNDSDLPKLQVGAEVTVDFNVEERQGPSGPYTQNMIQSVYTNGESPPSADWSTPGGEGPKPSAGSAPSPSGSRDDYWQKREAEDAQKTLQIEAAWGIKTAVGILSDEDRKKQERVRQVAIDLIAMKRVLAEELSKDAAWQS